MASHEWPINPTLPERFWPKVDVRGDDECWPWLAFRNWSGYGSVYNIGHMALAHRVAWTLAYGEIPGDTQVLHHCDNPPCVNHRHLYLGNNADNIRDKIERGRSSFPRPDRRGELHPLAKLTQAQVDVIRATPKTRGSGVQLANQYGVCTATISLIRAGKLWST